MTDAATTELSTKAKPTWADAASPRGKGVLASTRVRAALILAPLLVLIFLEPFKAPTDPDYWWHVRTGQYIFQTGSIPSVDLYSYTAIGHPWVTHEWLTELIFYVVSLHFGYVGNVVLFGLVGVLTGLTVYATCRRWGVGEFGSAILMVWASVLAEPSFNVRPQVVTALLVAICVLLLTRYRQGDKRALWPLPFIFALWVNLHGGYIIGLAVLGLAVVGAAFAAGLKSPVVPARPLLGFTALSAVATLLNPHGFEAWLYPFSYLGTGNASMRHVAEWQSPDFHQSYFLLLAATLLIVILLGVGRRPLGSTEILWTLAFTFLALQSSRNVMLFAVVVIPLLGARLQAEVPAFRRSLAAWQQPVLLALACPLLIAVIVATTLVQAQKTAFQTGWEPSAAGYPSGAVAYLRTHDLPGNLFNEYGWGGYLIYNLYPERRVFVDGRIDVYGDALGEQYDAVINLGPDWRRVLDGHDVRVVLVQKGGPLATALTDEPGWQTVYTGAVAKLFVRQAR